jgi:hypothetical protein
LFDVIVTVASDVTVGDAGVVGEVGAVGAADGEVLPLHAALEAPIAVNIASLTGRTFAKC